jgi:ligand-binding sensor domain-containing protein
MRTLRRQVEFLYAEIESRLGNQALLSKQNDELWQYSQELLESNKTNAALMKQYVAGLQGELRTANKERMELAEKLSMVRNSRELLQKINDEMGNVQLSAEDSRRLRFEAERELERAKAENASLEDELHQQVEKLQVMHLTLEEQVMYVLRDTPHIEHAIHRCALLGPTTIYPPTV